MKKLLIATPIHDSKPLMPWVESIDRARRELQDKVEIETLPACGDSLVANARNILVGTFLRDSTADALLFIDADESFMPRDVMAIVRGLDSGMPLCGAAYAKKLIDWEAIYLGPGKDLTPFQLAQAGSRLHNFTISPETKKLPVWRIQSDAGNYNYIEVEFCGTGFLGATRETLELLAEEVEKYHVRSNFDGILPVPALFADGVVNGRFVGEDVHFCKLAKKHGFPIHMFIDSQVSHWGLYEHPANARAALEGAGYTFEVSGVPFGSSARAKRS